MSGEFNMGETGEEEYQEKFSAPETIDGGGPYPFEASTDEPRMTVPKPTLITEHLGINKKGEGAKLNKRSVLLNIAGHQNDESFVMFIRVDEETGEPIDGFNMPVEMWYDFGMPETVTVVIYPKDILN